MKIKLKIKLNCLKNLISAKVHFIIGKQIILF
jgi:hypothetical protein